VTASCSIITCKPGDGVYVVRVEALEEPKVSDLGLQGSIEENVGRLDVAVNDPLGVEVPQGLGYPLSDGQTLLQV